MTIFNGKRLLAAAPLDPMLDHKARAHGVSHGLAECGYDITIKQEVRFQRINGRMGAHICNDGEWTFHPGRFVLASSHERFTMPTNLVGVVHDKSTWARQGLSVLNTVIESGWNGWLTLELIYHADERLVIPAGAGIAQVLFHELAEAADYGPGKYQGQPNRPVPAVMEKGK